MSKKKENKLVPRLRFPEFENESEWEQATVEELIQKEIIYAPKDGNHGNLHPKSSDYVKKGIPFIMASDLKNGEIDFLNCAFLKKEQADSLKKGYAQIGDVLISHKGTVGEVAMILELKFPYAVLTPQVTYYRIRNKSKMANVFLAAFFNSDFFQKKMFDISGGGTRAYVGITQQLNLEIIYPSKILEQQKIASCLSSLDELITAESQKLTILKVHKKGLLQNLLPQEGETIPKFRFKEFVKNGEWEEKRLDDVCKFIRGPFGGALKKEIFVRDGYAVYEQSHAIYADFTSFRYFITEEKYNELKRFAIQSNDIIMSCSGTMGKFAIIPDHSKNGIINQALLKLSIKAGNDTYFVKASLELPSNQNKLLSQSNGGAIKNVVEVAQIKEIKISIPSLSEQQKIAKTLSSIDELINSQSKKVEALKLHKRGLLQGLFPQNIETEHSLSLPQ